MMHFGLATLGVVVFDRVCGCVVHVGCKYSHWSGELFLYAGWAGLEVDDPVWLMFAISLALRLNLTLKVEECYCTAVHVILSDAHECYVVWC